MSKRQNQPTYDFLSGEEPPSHQLSTAATTFRPNASTATKAGELHQDPSHDAALIELNAVKYELATLKDEREREKLQQNQEIRELKQKLQEGGAALEKEASEKNFLFKRQETLAEELKRASEEVVKEKEARDKKIRALEMENNKLSEELGDKENELHSMQRLQKRELDNAEMKYAQLNAHLEEAQRDIDTQTAALQDCQKRLVERDEELAELQKEHAASAANAGDRDTINVLKRELNEQLTQLRDLDTRNRKQESELKNLREYSKSYSMLEEQKKSLEAKVALMDDLREQLSNTEIQLTVLKEEKNSWTSFLQDEDSGMDFQSPEHLVRAFLQERLEKAQLLEKFGRAEPESLEKDQIIDAMEREQKELRGQIEELNEELKKDVKGRQRLERQKELAQKEAQFLREQLKTYASEETVFMSGNFDDQKSQRIEELEALLEEHKREIAALTTQLAAKESWEHTNSPSKRNRDDEPQANKEAVGQLTRKIRKLQDDLGEAEKAHQMAVVEVQSLQKRLAAAETTSQMRVLQLKDNPTSRHEAVKREMLDSLKEENASLVAQLEGRPGVGKLVPISTLENSRIDIKEMEKVVAEKEKRMMRLKEMWSKKVLEFRQAVFSLLGYEVDFQPNGKVKITSMFHRPNFYGGIDTGIMFDGENGTMKLCGGQNTQFAREIKNQLKFYVEERKEIPCFLAALTLEGYEKTTRAQA